ncbi:UDP-N-acetylglucosamine 2-epimerase, partial [bacterium]|nr:UDP-N-acetylglucosamine 2-epimerase [bacterium]
RDREMPEEINRLVTDAITDLYITTSQDASENLFNEGISEDKVHMLGNLMIDSLVSQLEQASAFDLKLRDLTDAPLDQAWSQSENGYAVMTFHRPSNVDEKQALGVLVDQWIKTSELLPIIFPIHPRTQNRLEEFGLMQKLQTAPNVYLTGPLAYLEFLKLVSQSALVITDSGGIQEETTYLKIPCLTVRPSTERPITIWEGSNQLIKAEEIYSSSTQCLRTKDASYRIPKYWDGNTASRIVQLLESYSQA